MFVLSIWQLLTLNYAVTLVLIVFFYDPLSFRVSFEILRFHFRLLIVWFYIFNC